MRIACWITKATNTHTGCVTLITFPMQQWLKERASALRYTYIAWLVVFNYGIFFKTQPIAHTIGLRLRMAGMTNCEWHGAKRPLHNMW